MMDASTLSLIHIRIVKWTAPTPCVHYLNQCPEKILDIIDQNPSDSKPNRLHVVIFRVPFIKWRYLPYIPLE